MGIREHCQSQTKNCKKNVSIEISSEFVIVVNDDTSQNSYKLSFCQFFLNIKGKYCTTLQHVFLTIYPARGFV